MTPYCKPQSTDLEVDADPAVRLDLADGDQTTLACDSGNLESQTGQCRYISCMFASEPRNGSRGARLTSSVDRDIEVGFSRTGA